MFQNRPIVRVVVRWVERVRLAGVICFRAAFVLLGVVSAAEAEPPAVQQFFQKHCLRCHGPEQQKGNFRLDTQSRDFTTTTVAENWSEVRFRINAGEMPPKKEPQPSADEIATVVDWITAQLKEGEAGRMAKRGPVALYRLSRDEYANTVYDMLGVFYDAHLPGAFNEDPRWHGFERIGSLLSLSPSHVERYFKAAETVLDRAYPAQPPRFIKGRHDAIEMRHRDQRKRIEAMGIADKVRAVMWPDGSLPAFRGYWYGQVKDSGLYRARVQLSGMPGLDGRAPHLSVWHTGLKRTVFDEDILAPEDKPIVIEFEVFLDMPCELDFMNEVPRVFVRDGNHTLNVLNMGGSIFTSTKDVGRINPTGYKLTTDDNRAIYPLLLVDWVEWEGPLTSEADLKKREGLVPAKAGDLVEARECVQRFATRAWRRPAAAAEIDRYMKVVEQELAAGENFTAAYRAAMVGVLSSRSFYYLEEGSPTERRDTVNDWELASRLSYFLWGSLPDEELLSAAGAGTLHQPDVLRSQLARMLADPKIRRFTESFPRQWLQLYKVGVFPPDLKLYPDYDLWLQKSMVLETTGFFAEVLQQNLSIREFLTSDWTMVNPRLALHYQLPPLKASGLQRVALRPEDHRGGLLTQASVLMLTSDGTRHRPVHRGVLVSEAIFGKTPPPPPPNVEPLEPIPNTQPKATVRNQLESHTTHAICASCHRQIDPLGFAFDNYDAIGRWRTEEFVEKGQGANPPVNAAGELPDGRKFQNAHEFKTLLAQDVDRFAAAFVEQLATFALRRVMTIDDAEDLKAITDSSRKDGYKLKGMLDELVLSPMFKKR